LDCADDRLLEPSNVKKICEVLGTEIGRFKRIRFLGASEPIAHRSRNGGDLSLFEEQFRVASEMGVEDFGFGHHGDCQWYKAIINRRMVGIELSFQEVEPYYKKIEKVVQYGDLLESYKWVMRNKWFEECILTFADHVDKSNFIVDVLSPTKITHEISSLRKELSAEFTSEQLGCLGVI
jgi:hypothetical protein